MGKDKPSRNDEWRVEPEGPRRKRKQLQKPQVIKKGARITVEPDPCDEKGGQKKPADAIATHVMAAFKYTLLGVLTLGGVMIIVGVRNPTAAKSLQEMLKGFFDSSAYFISTVFGPLLGLVCGYYFAKKRRS
jgi:hypothetical protein